MFTLIFFRGWRKAINGEKKYYFLVWLNCLIKSFNAYFFAYERCQLYEQKSNTFVGPPHIYIRIPPKDEIRNLLTRNKEFSNIKKNDILYMFFLISLYNKPSRLSFTLKKIIIPYIFKSANKARILSLRLPVSIWWLQLIIFGSWF